MWNISLTFLKWLQPRIKASVPVLIGITFILVNVAIWWAGPWLKVKGITPLTSLTSRAVTSVIFSLSCFTVWGALQWRKVHKINQENAKQSELENDPALGYVETQEAELNDVIHEMKASLDNDNYLYTLPWYLVLGLEESGKTSLINRSGQNYVFTSVRRASGKISKNPHSFDWWVGDDSVLIDPDGELLTQRQHTQGENGEVERRLWQHFVGWLGKTRKRKPLNGVVLAVDFAHLLNADVAERQAYSSLIRARLSELTDALSVKLPIYIAFTKLDLLYGFEPLFRYFNREQRQQALGFTFTLDPVRESDSWLVEFEQNYSQFVQRLNDMLPVTLKHVSNAEERAGIYSFSRQIAGMQSVLKKFLSDALVSDQFDHNTLVRGAYFTSVYQQGVPTDAFVNAAARRYNLSESVHSAQQSNNSTTFFVKELFEEIIYPEAGLATDNSKAAEQKKKVLALSFLACAIGSALIIGSWQKDYEKNLAKENDILEHISEYNNEVTDDSILQSELSMLVPLETMRSAVLDYGDFKEKPKFVTDMGLYQGRTVGPAVQKAYLDLLDYHFIPALMRQLAVDLSLAKTQEEKLDTLRVFRMLTDKSGRQNQVVENYFDQVWQKEFPTNLSAREQLQSQLSYALNNTDLQAKKDAGDPKAVNVLQPFHGLIQQTQQSLGSISVADRVYRHLQKKANAEMGMPLDVKTAIGPVFDLVFNEREVGANGLHVPLLYTALGFNSYFLTQSGAISKLASVDSWVLGQSNNGQLSQQDKQALRDKIRDLYVEDYTNKWRTVINDINIKYFPDLDSAVSVLSSLIGPQQPLLRLLNTLSLNTRLFPDLPKNSQARMVLMQSPQYKIASMIALPFTNLDSMTAKQNKQPAYITEVMKSVAQVYNYLKAIQDAPDVGKAALAAAKARVQLKSTDPIYTLQRIASGLPAPLNTMMKRIADQSWFVVKQTALNYLQSRWQSQVYSVFEKQLASRYPFNPHSDKDVSLKDFENFFAPNGTLENFYNSQLKVFVDAGVPLSLNPEPGSVLNKTVAQEFAAAKEIQSAFFDRKGNLDVEFSIKPIELSANQRRSVLNVDGQYVEFSHGPRRSVDLIWPNTLRAGTTSSLSLVPDDIDQSPRGYSIHGPWAFFRLLDQGTIVGSSSSTVDYQFNANKGEVEYRITSDSDANPFTDSILKTFTLSKHLS
ncbi:type VI secretion system membrane subunit TssM [Vibrio sp. S4M6]|uniref:type VI secretion system membrane subunit TssM n=1 Tax=Vibrio sinus TaxID=2946865 RepID=UPI002029E011|nr:type VI secretion system membrane subunit TssM [Vibrio sinus]MCL9781353.1 type VI secretion system membrane subunit TssM [Vibrio sinus]